MRALCASFLLFVFLAAASAADLKVKVIDPQSAAVSGAQVSLLSKGSRTAIKVSTTSPEGIASLGDLSSGSYQIQILAPGFAPHTEDVTAHSDVITIQLHLATASETVVVTATRTLVPAGETGASVSTLENEQLETMQPVAADDAVRFLPGAVVNTAGQRGGFSSLFVRGGESTYNKVIVDGVAIDNPGETFDYGTLPLTQADRVEFLRGAQSTLYGSDAMTSVVQVWTRTGSTSVPELQFGADGGNFGTANGNLSLSGAHARFDYNFFGDQFNSNGLGVNDAYSDSLQGANLGMSISDHVTLRVRARHSNSYTGLPGEWNFNGDALLAPDSSESSHLNNILGSVELAVAAPSGWQHRFTAFDSLYRYTDSNLNPPADSYDNYADLYQTHVNRVGVEYQGDYSERTSANFSAHSTFGVRIENETGIVSDMNSPPPASGQRLDQDAYLQQQFTLGRFSAIAGGRFVHSSAYGNIGVPRVALTLLALRGGDLFSGTRLRFSYAIGYMEPALYQTFGEIAYDYTSNRGLLPERTRAFEAGFEQKLFAGRWALNAAYFNNLFHDQIEAVPTSSGAYQFFNLEQSFAQGAEVELQGRIRPRLSLTTAYTYTSTQILENPQCTPATPCGFPYAPGDPLLRRPKHSATTLLSYLGKRWGGNLAGSFVGARPDDDFAGFSITHAAGYVRADVGGWYAINSRITAYANIENALDRRYNEVVGYPALPINFRAGFRFRIGGE
ncbi:MAG: TonB-dependent receptor plug domain-containing protein [Candidatus Sulfotelmatobacter sp.]|jgi:outer membrane cobalamin receptor